MNAVPPTIEALLVHRDFLRGLARGLLGRDDLAEDVVQETYRKALGRPLDPVRSTRGWLGTIARNTALRLRQREARRPQVEATFLRDTATGKAPTPAEILEREALRQRVVHAVLALPDGDREVLVLRYYEDLPPRVIAARLSLPVETVRTRVKRALVRLRAALDEDETKDWRAWALGLLPAEGLRGAGAAGATVLGWIAMKKLLIVTACAAFVLLAGWWAGDLLGLLPDREQEHTSEPIAVLPADGGEGTASQDAGPRLEGAARNASDPVPEATPYGVVRGRVVDFDGRPVRGARIWVGSTQAPRWVASMHLDAHHATSDAQGQFSFAPREPADRVRAAADGYVSDAAYWRGGSAPVVLVLRRTNALVEGTIRDLEGNPVANALVSVTALYGTQPSSAGRSDHTGRFSVPFVTGSQSWVGAWAPGFLAASVWIPGFDAEGHAEVELVLRPGYWIEGRVTDAKSGAPVAGASLTSYERYGPVPKTDREGRFRYQATREIDEITGTADGHQPRTVRLAFADGSARAEIVLEPLDRHDLHGVVLDPDGVPVADAEVLAGDARARTDAHGRFHLSCRTKPGEVVGVLVARAGDATPAVVVRPEPDDEITLTLGRPAPVAGRVILESGESAEGAWLRVVPVGGEDVARAGAALAALGAGGPHGLGAEGTFRLLGLPRGRYSLQAFAGGAQNGRPAKVEVDVSPGRPVQGVEIRMPAGRVLKGRVLGPDGRPVPFAALSTYGEGAGQSGTADTEGRFRIAGLPASKITLHVTSPRYRLWTGKFTVLDEDVTITLRRSVRLRFVLEGEVPPSGSWVMVWFREPGQGGWGGAGGSVASGMVVYDLIHGAKAYEYALKGDGWETEPVRVDPVAGTWELEVPVEVESAPPARHTQVFETNPGQTKSIDVEERPTPTAPPETGTIHGSVAGSEGDHAGSWVVARGVARTKVIPVGDGEQTVDDTPTHQVPVGTDGRFRLEEIPVGAWTLFCRRGSRHENEIEVTVAANRTIEVNDLRAPERGPSIHGVVLDAEGRPVPELEVKAQPSTFGRRWGWVKTGSDGSFEIDDLEPGGYALSASDTRGQVESRTVSAGSRDVELRLTEHGLLRGTFSGGWGDEDLPQGRVFIAGVSEGRLTTSASLQRNGDVFTFERGLPPGEYEIAARVGRFVTATETSVTVRSGVPTPRLDLALVPGGTVTVVLVDASGAPQRGEVVDLPRAWHQEQHVMPDPDGTFRYEGVPPGTWALKAYGRAGVGEVVLDVAEGETVRLEIVLRK